MILYRFGKDHKIGLVFGYIEATAGTIPNRGIMTVVRLSPAIDWQVCWKALRVVKLALSWIMWEIRIGVVWRTKGRVK